MARDFDYSAWQGEIMPREYNEEVPFYLYSTAAQDFVRVKGNDPTLTFREGDPVLFIARNNMGSATDTKRQNELVFRYTCGGRTYYVKYGRENIFTTSDYYTTSKSLATSFNCDTQDLDTDPDSRKVKLYSLTTNQSGLMYLNTTKDGVNFKTAKKSKGEYQWYLISKKQYDNRQALADLIRQIESLEDGPEKDALMDALDKAVYAAMGNSGADIEAQYHALQETLHNNALLHSLDSVLLVSSEMIEALHARLGEEPTGFKGAYDAGKAVLQETPLVADKIPSCQAELESWCQVMNTDAFDYISELKELTQAMGYAVPVSQAQGENNINVALDKIKVWISSAESEKDSKYSDVLSSVESLREDYFQWVSKEISYRHGYPVGTDFSAYIRNRFLDPAASVGQTRTSSLPSGKYLLSANALSGAALSVSGEGVSDIETSDEGVVFSFENKVGNAVLVSISGAEGAVVDNLRLSLVGGLAAQYVLDEASTVENNILEGNYEKVIVHRPLKVSTSWNTLCLPISLNPDSTQRYFSEVRQLTGVEKSDDTYTLKYSTATEIVAGECYLVKATEAFSDIIKENAAIERVAPNNDNVFGDEQSVQLLMRGTFRPYSPSTVKIPMIEGCVTYILQQNNFYYLTAASQSKISMNGYRAFFHLKEAVPSASAQLRLSLVDEDEMETAIEEVQEATASAAIYDLNGVHVNRASRGLYLQNNKLIYLK